MLGGVWWWHHSSLLGLLGGVGIAAVISLPLSLHLFPLLCLLSPQPHLLTPIRHGVVANVGGWLGGFWGSGLWVGGVWQGWAVDAAAFEA